MTSMDDVNLAEHHIEPQRFRSCFKYTEHGSSAQSMTMSSCDDSTGHFSTATARSNTTFAPHSNEKRNLWWRAFRSTVLELHGIHILEHPGVEKMPAELLKLVEERSKNIGKYEEQTTLFHRSVKSGNGFGPSPIFPPDILPSLVEEKLLARCMEPAFDPQTVPPPEVSIRIPLFDVPAARPSLACGFSKRAFTAEEFEELPIWLGPAGTTSDYSTGQVNPGQAVYSPFLIFERTHGHAKHEIESAMNHCAIGGSSALYAVKQLYGSAFFSVDDDRPTNPPVFSCIIDDDLAILNSHWTADDETLCIAPLLKFDLRDGDHFMHFLAWTEAIQEWALKFLLPDVKKALNKLIYDKGKQLLTPFSDTEKKEMRTQSMKTEFQDVPWKNGKIKAKPLSVTGMTRLRSPPVISSPITENTGLADPSMIPLPASRTGKGPPPMSRFENGDSHSLLGSPGSVDMSSIVVSAPDFNPKRPFIVGLQSPEIVIISQPASRDALRRRRSGMQYEGDSVSISTVPEDLPSIYSPSAQCETTEAYSNASVTDKVSDPIARPKAPTPSNVLSTTQTVTNPGKATQVKPLILERTTIGHNNGFRSRLKGSLEIIMEHARTRKGRNDNSAPTSAQSGLYSDGTIHTPAYDKRTFADGPDIKAATIDKSSISTSSSQSSRIKLVSRERTNIMLAQDSDSTSSTLPLRRWTPARAGREEVT